MNRAAFRKFEFFEFDVISQNLGSAIGGVPTCSVAESGLLIFGDELGNIIFADRDLKVAERKHKIFNSEVLGLSYVLDTANQNRQYIVALGDDARPSYDATAAYNASPVASTPVYVIKVFSITDFQHPIQIINATINDATVTSFAVHSEGLEVAVGYSSGKVLVFTNVVSRDSQARAQTPTVLLSSHFSPVSNLFFCESNSKSAEVRRIKLFVVMDTPHNDTHGDPQPMNDLDQDDIENAGIMVFDVSLNQLATKGVYVISPKQSPKALDDKGASKLHACFFKATSELVVARHEALYTYTVEDKGGAIAIFGEKLCLHCVGRYTLIISLDEKNTPANSNAITSEGSFSVAATSQANSNKAKKATINIYDTKNRFVCYSSKKQLPATDKVSIVMSDTGVVYLATVNGSLLRYKEKDPHAKLQVLLEQSDQPLYSLAITLAGEEQLDATEIMKLYKQYGDHLYAQHEFEAAITQYCYTIGYIPPSYVIIKFLDPYRIVNLVTYLEKIRERGVAASNHVTLLVSCYAKLQEEGKIAALLDALYSETKLAFLALHEQQQQQHQQLPGQLPAQTTPAVQPALNVVHNFRALTLQHQQQQAQQQHAQHQHPSASDLLAPASSQLLLVGDGMSAQALVAGGHTPHPTAFFDPVQTIQTLLSAHYVDLALQVALRYGQHDEYLQIQLSKEPPRADEALGYLAYLAFVAPPDDLIHLLLRFGNQLLSLRPQAFTHLLIKLCTNALDTLLSVTAANLEANPKGSNTNNGSNTSKTLTKTPWVATKEDQAQQQSAPLAFAPLLRALQSLLDCKLTAPSEYYLSVIDVLPLYADQPSSLLATLLEGIVAASQQRVLPAKLWTTLLEVYLGQYQALVAQQAQKGGEAHLEDAIDLLETRLLSLLDGVHVSYDSAHVLLLCHVFGFAPGARYLLEKQNYLELVLLQVMQNAAALTGQGHHSSSGQGRGGGLSGHRLREQRQKAARDLFKLLRKEGTKDPELFVQVLRYLVQQTLPANSSTTSSANGAGGKTGGARATSKVEGGVRGPVDRPNEEEDDEDDEEDEERKVDRGLRRQTRRRSRDDGSSDTDEDDEDEEEDDDEEDDGRWDVIVDLIDLIEKEGILSPIQVLSILAQNPHLPLHVVADYVQHTFKEVSEGVQSIEADVAESKRKLDAVTSVSLVENEFKKRGTQSQKKAKASNNRNSISKHKKLPGAPGFNPFADDEDDDEDEDDDHEEDEDEDEEERLEAKRKEQEHWDTIRQRQVECSQDHESFFKELEQAADGFSTVAGYFGRSLIYY